MFGKSARRGESWHEACPVHAPPADGGPRRRCVPSARRPSVPSRAIDLAPIAPALNPGRDKGPAFFSRFRERECGMKRFLVIRLLAVLAFTVVLLGLLAAPALASTPAPNWRPALKTAYVFTYNGGSWFEGTGDPSAPTLIEHWADFDDVAGDWVPGTADPIPADHDVVMQLSWKDIGYWEVAAFSLATLIDLGIPEAGVKLSKTQSMAFWTGPILWDKYWEDATGLVMVPYDPRLKLKGYANRYLVPLTGKKGIATNLTANKKLPQGTYTVHYKETYVLPVVDLSLQDPPQTKPVIYWPGPPYVNPPFTFTVGVPTP